jgi:stringent starvation protein B
VTPSRPYIVRAIYEWIVDNDCTPHLLVDANGTDVVVPTTYVSDGQIVLNISPTAVVSLQMGNHSITFNGRFGGQPIDIFVPIASVMGIYARENGQGMIFDTEPEPQPPHSPEPPERIRPSLKVVK